VTGVQTCALPIYHPDVRPRSSEEAKRPIVAEGTTQFFSMTMSKSTPRGPRPDRP
jgi:hypothetical protein